MRALVVETFGAAPVVREVPPPRCPPHGVVVRVEATGLCRGDWHALMESGPLLATMGEAPPAGMVVALPSG